MTNLLAWLESALQSYGWLGLLIGTLLEEVIVPLPSSLIMMGGGFFLIKASSFIEALRQTLVFFVPIGLVGVMAGSIFWYAAAHWLEEITIKRWGKYLGISWDELKGIEHYFKNRTADEWVLLALRAIPIFPGALTAVFAGLIRMPFKKFIVFGSLGTAIRLMIMGLLGWFFQEMYVFYASYFEQFSFVGALVMLLGVGAAYFLIKKKVHQAISR
jgi:membrane protein DedA with SNARE-associated domain